MKLYQFWRSIASYRVRMMMNLKAVNAEVESIDLLKGHQHSSDYAAVNPQKLLPALILDDGGPPLFQSMAIMEYLEETHPQPPLLPKDARGRARVRGLSQICVSDAHPLSVPRIRNYLTKTFALDQAKLLQWIQHWLGAGLAAMETMLGEHRESGRLCHGEQITLADICLVTQVTPAQTFKCDLAPYPRVMRIYDGLMALPAFADASPARQPDAE